MKPDRTGYDVVVIGGGPAGSTAAALTAGAGLRVAVLEKKPFPRYQIGESLMPACYWTFRRLGVLDRLRQSRFVEKESVQFFSADGRGSTPYYFPDFDPHESSYTWQVERGPFDEMLLDNAREKGAEVVQPATVRNVLFDGDRAVGVAAILPDGSRQEILADVVVDASGGRAILARELGLRRLDPNLMHCAYYSQFRGAYRDPGRDEGATLVIATQGDDRNWFWYIALPDDRVSVGVVGHLDDLVRSRSDDPQRVFDEEVARCPVIAERIAAAEQVFPVRVIRDFSYCSREIAGHGWVLTGDAFGFLDPVYSSGVFLAFKSAEFAADNIVAAADAGDFSAGALGRHGPVYVAGMDAIRRMVYAFYEPGFNFARFVRTYPEHADALVHLLIGNVYREDVSGLLKAMDEFCPLPDYEPFEVDRAAVRPAS